MPPVWFEVAALPAGALQHVNDLASVDVPQGCVQILHCWDRREEVLEDQTHAILESQARCAGLADLGQEEVWGRETVPVRG